jgi:hypothetical protein
MTETSADGARYYVCFKDDYSKFRRVFIKKKKGEVEDCLRKFLNEVKTAGHVTKIQLSAGGKEFNCEGVRKVLEEHGITHRITMPYTPEQNDAAEQENCTIMESARSMLHAIGLPKELGLKPAILQYTYPTILDLHQWKVRCLWSCGLDLVQLLVICVFLGQNVMCTSPNRKGTSGTKRVGWVNWSDIWVKRMAIEFGYLTKERLF